MRNMSDSNNGGLDPVDQGTIFMLSLSFGLLAMAAIYFSCKWYRKRKSKQVIRKKAAKSAVQSKSNVQRSFSRFSHVDDECTYIDDHAFDPAIFQSSPHSLTPHTANKTKRSATLGTGHTPSRATSVHASSAARVNKPSAKEHRKSAPPADRIYLETSI